MLVIALAATVLITSCGDEGEIITVDTFEVEADEILSGVLSAQTLSASKTYKLDGIVSIESGELVIEAGTKIYGKIGSALVIGKGATINAVGTASNPIVMTSALLSGLRSTGDWAGLVIVGNSATGGVKSPVEGFPSSSGALVQFGSDAGITTDGAGSGTLSYVRIEYAGYELTPNNEINSLTLGGVVGSGTTIDHIHIHKAKDDGMEVFGGDADITYMVFTQTQDDDIDLDDSFSGSLQYGIVWRNAKVTDQSGSSGVESGDKGTQAYSLSNVTFFGPLMQTDDYAGINYGVQLKGDSDISFDDNIFVGWPTVTEGEKAGEFGSGGDASTMINSFDNNWIVGGGDEASEQGESDHFYGMETNNADVDGYKTFFGTSADLTDYSFAGFNTIADITPVVASRIDGVDPSYNVAAAGATVGTAWNYTSGWILFDDSSVDY